MKKYLVSMVLSGKYSYVLTESDYEQDGFIDIDVDNFSVDSIEEANKIKSDLTSYARENGDNTTEFIIEELQKYVTTKAALPALRANKMEKYTIKQLKSLVNNGVAKDVTYSSQKSDIPENYTKIGYAAGLYGCNGMLLKGVSGQLYAVTGRTSAIYIF